jgi:hypothetical protein
VQLIVERDPKQSGPFCVGVRPCDCSCFLEMSEGDCKPCRSLVDEASRAISAHVTAVSLLGDAVSLSETAESINRLKEAVRATSAARQIAVECYENHRAAHELKVMTAGSRFPE